MKLDFYESDILSIFLTEQKSEFIKLAQNFGWSVSESKQMHREIRDKILDEFEKSLVTPARLKRFAA